MRLINAVTISEAIRRLEAVRDAIRRVGDELAESGFAQAVYSGGLCCLLFLTGGFAQPMGAVLQGCGGVALGFDHEKLRRLTPQAYPPPVLAS
jgi:hypothetical protein